MFGTESSSTQIVGHFRVLRRQVEGRKKNCTTYFVCVPSQTSCWGRNSTFLLISQARWGARQVCHLSLCVFLLPEFPGAWYTFWILYSWWCTCGLIHYHYLWDEVHLCLDKNWISQIACLGDAPHAAVYNLQFSLQWSCQWSHTQRVAPLMKSHPH